MLSEVPADWSSKTLKELGSTYSGLGGKTKADFGHGKPFVTYKQVFSGSVIDLAECDLVSVSPDERQHRVCSGDVLFTTSSETPEEVAYSSAVLADVPELYLNSFCFGFRPTSPQELWPEFSTYLFRGPEFRRAAMRLGQGSTRFNISKTRLMNVALSLPPLPEQKKIAAILSSVDEAIQAKRAVIEQTRRVKEGLLQDLLTKGIGHTRFKQTEIGEIPETWEVRCVGELLVERTEAARIDSGAPLYSLIIGQGVVPKPERYERAFLLRDREANEYSVVRPGDIVINPMNLRWGAIGQHRGQERVLVSAYYKVLRVRPEVRRRSHLVYRLLSRPAAIIRYENISEGSLVEKKRVHWSVLKGMKFAVPPEGESERLSSAIEAVEVSLAKSEESKKRLSRLKQGLLQDLLTGKVRVPV